MIYCVLFEDTPGRETLRQQHMAAHLEFLASRGQQVQGAGPLLENGEGQGGMWIVEAGSAEDVQELVQADPFWPTGLRKSVRILEWRQVFREGARV
ncbi:YciI family protein [Leisingera sp. ANG-Vp]|uniref:YciI family protein n=1 Tax=Leisingera sp. ANG-Vp TaxID=1577896 RepID=UPI00057C4323|nr:YciI family protein [Leisingera sp. ANG-Vp]KIC21609.1 hypothetical protein RA20_03040 [Leisingera sp. ANG-Vp]